jgi:predicted RNA-binding protein (virulence factor B family)
MLLVPEIRAGERLLLYLRLDNRNHIYRKWARETIWKAFCE